MAKRIYRKKHTCCICGKKFQEWPNDPWPVNMDDDAECCDDCNWKVVMPARIAQAKKAGVE